MTIIVLFFPILLFAGLLIMGIKNPPGKKPGCKCTGLICACEEKK